MAFKSIQQTISTGVTAVTPLTAANFANISGSVQDPLPILITNNDTQNYVYVGGPGVTDTTGTPIYPQAQLPLSVYGPSDLPYIYSPSANVVICVLCGRQ